MIRRAVLPLIAVFLAACTPIIKPVAVSPTDTAQAAVTPTSAHGVPSPTPQNAWVTAAQSLHVRQQPGEKALVIGYLYATNSVTLTGKCQTGWAQIIWEGSRAWVNADYLSDNKCKE